MYPSEPGCHSGSVSSSLLKNVIYERLVNGRMNKVGYGGISLHVQVLSLTICEFSMNQKWALLQRQRAEVGVMLDTVQEESAKGTKRF